MILTISCQKGGVGKSILAFNIAVELSKKYKVVVIDLDNQQTTFSFNSIRNHLYHKSLTILGLNKDRDFIEFVYEHDRDDTIVVIDSGGFDSEQNRLSISLADYIITPISAEFTDILGLEWYENILKELSELSNNHLISNIVLNKINHSQKNFSELKEFIESSNHFKLFNTILRRRVDFSNSVAQGLSVVELDSSSNASIELNSLIKEIKKELLDG